MILFKKDIAEGVDTLNKGGVVLFPSDGTWVIGCDANNEIAIDRMYKLIGKKDTARMVLLLANEAAILDYTNQKDIQIIDYIQGLCGPITTIYQQAKNVSPLILSKRKTIAIRVTENIYCKNLVLSFKKPLVCVEATIRKQQLPIHFNEIDPTIVQGVDFIFDVKQKLSFRYPSPIIRWEKDGSLSILRS